MQKSFLSKFVVRAVRVIALLALAFPALGSPQPVLANGGTTIYVDTNTDNDTGGDAFCTLREAINSANANSNAGHAECEAGTGDDSIVFNGDYTITLASELPIIAPVGGAGETLQIGGNVVNTIIQANAAANTATYRIFNVSATGNLSLERLTLRHGKCDTGCVGATGKGGAIFNNGGTVHLTRVLLASNFARSGGAIENSGILQVTDSYFQSNQTIASGGLSNGGAINDDSTSGSMNVSSSTFDGNFTVDADPSYGLGGAINIGSFAASAGTYTIAYNTFYQNHATSGGAIYADNRTLNISGSTFDDNSANLVNGGGGAIYLELGSTSVANSTFYGNDARAGGAMRVDGGTPALKNVTFNSNTAALADGGGALYNYLTNPTLTNVIMWDDTADGVSNEIKNYTSGCPAAPCLPTFTNSVVEGSGGSGAWVASFGTNGGGNLDADPKLGALADNGGLTETMALLAGSSAINKGDDTTCGAWPVSAKDQRGVNRSYGQHCDIGAFERVPPPEKRADFDNDGNTDLSVFRPSTGVWYIKNVVNTTWGTTGDVPVPGDYDGDGDSEVAIWRPSTGIWYIKGLFNSAWGAAGDVPVPGDYDGDGDTDVAVWRPSNGTWYVKNQSTTAWGSNGDIPVQQDYDGNGTTDLAVFRPSTGVWYIKGVFNTTWGSSTDIPVPGDYNMDRNADVAIFRPSTGIWYIKGLFNSAWGSATDIAVPGDYDGDGDMDVAIWRPSNGTWYVKGQFSTAWGSLGDFPLPARDTNGDGDPYQ